MSFFTDSEQLFVHCDTKFDASSFPKSSDLDLRSNYLFNSGIAALEDADFVLIVGSNPRFEAPLVNARLRKAWRESTLNEIALVGPKDLDLLYDYTWLGDDVNTLSQIQLGNHPITEKIKSAKNPVIILGQQILSSGSSSQVYDLVKSIASKYNATFDLLHSNASQVAAYDLGFKPSTELNLENDNKPAVFWLFGVDDATLNIPSNTFVVYQVSFWQYFEQSLNFISRDTTATSELIKQTLYYLEQRLLKSKERMLIWKVELNRHCKQSHHQVWPELTGK